MCDYEQRIVFFIDILGFKNIIDEHKISVDEMLNKFDYAQYHLDYTNWIQSKRDIKHSSSRNSRKYLQMSDSIVLSFRVDEPSGLYYSILDIMKFQASFAASHGMLFRGGCVFGELYHDGSNIFGPAMNKVVNMEKLAKYPRIIIPNKIIDICKGYSSIPNYPSNDEKKDILNLLTMDKDGYYYIDYISYDTFGQETQNDSEWADYISVLYRRIRDGLYEQEALDKYLWLKEKYNNALNRGLIKHYEEDLNIRLGRL